jgi:hypothetical protein
MIRITSLGRFAATIMMVGVFLQSATASAVVLDYNAFDPGIYQHTVIEDGFSTTSSRFLFITDHYLVTTLAGERFTIAQVGGEPFSLCSIDFRLGSYFLSNPFTVFGDQVGGGTATQLISGHTTSLQTYTFGPAFSNVLAVRFTQGPDTGPDDDISFDNVNLGACEYESEDAAIDIKPGSDPNAINPSSKGMIPVAILGSDTFDVLDVDPDTLAFGPAGAFIAHKNGPHFEDVNDDGFEDLLAHFRTQETGIDSEDLDACLTWENVDATPFEACDDIVIVPACGIGFELAFLLPPLAWLRRQRRCRIH